jgi:hypothetical protein
LVRRRSPSMANRPHIPKVFPPCHHNPLPPAKAMKPICRFLFRGDAARRRRATVESGRRTTTTSPYRPQNGNPSTPYNMHAALRLWRSCRPAYRSHLVTAGPHRAENPAWGKPRCDDLVRRTGRASEGLAHYSRRQLTVRCQTVGGCLS